MRQVVTTQRTGKGVKMCLFAGGLLMFSGFVSCVAGGEVAFGARLWLGGLSLYLLARTVGWWRYG